mgnify:FL=1|tara:strand:- start:1258 stop:1653 length:396 start_codon:yes stop_codon:yes gene_type:complete
MKITKARLKQIIKEELSGTLQEDGHTDVPSAARKLKASVEDSMNILSILETHPDANLPSWWMSKITLASDYLNKARDYVLYDGRPTQGEEELDEGRVKERYGLRQEIISMLAEYFDVEQEEAELIFRNLEP